MNKSRWIIQKTKQLLCAVFGWFLTCFWGLCLIVVLFDWETTVFIMSIIFTTIGVFLIIKGKKIKKETARFKTYIDMVANQGVKSIQNIANSSAQSMDTVMQDLNKMIDKGFIKNAYIDMKDYLLVINGKQSNSVASQTVSVSQGKMIVIRCNGCGANNKVNENAIGECDYCGTPLSK